MSDGRIVMTGDTVVARFLPDGSLDTSFGGGAIQTQMPDDEVMRYEDVAVQADGRVVAVGAGSSIARYSPCDCSACEVCDGLGGCVAAPRTGCYRARSTSITLKNSPDDIEDAVTWKWSQGEAVHGQALGLPYGATDYAFCVYDESAGTALVAHGSLPAGAACSGEHCWRTSGTATSAKFKDKDAVTGSIAGATIKSGADFKPSIRVKGTGADLDMAALPTTGPVRVQLQAENGQCWEMTYEADDVIRADGGSYKATTDSSDF